MEQEFFENWLSKAVELSSNLENASEGSVELDLAIAEVIGFFDRYAVNLERSPSALRLSLKTTERWNSRPKVSIQVLNEYGGGLIYEDDIPRFSQDLTSALQTIPKRNADDVHPVVKWTIGWDDGEQEAWARIGLNIGAWHSETEARGATPELALCSSGIATLVEVKTFHMKHYREKLPMP